jgi:putative mRNA 3-end processing factor
VREKRYNALMEPTSSLQLTAEGLYCAAGDFHVDPWKPVDRAVVTHAHADHSCWGCKAYLTSREGEHVLRTRMGGEAKIEAVAYGESVSFHGVRVSLHPAGHILGSSQVRIEHRGRVCVVSGDYKVEPDATCATLEPVRCHEFISESTFGLPIYRWPAQGTVFDEVNAWWRSNQAAGKASLLFAYALGKSQRLLAGLDPDIGPIYTHGAVEKLNRAYRETGVALPETTYAGAQSRGVDWSRAMILAPPPALGTPWARKFGPSSSGFASGWMQIRGARRRRSVDRGFVLSDHADWQGLLGAIDASGAETVWLTHGYTAVLARWLREHGRDARTIATHYQGERDDSAAEGDEDAERDRGVEP